MSAEELGKIDKIAKVGSKGLAPVPDPSEVQGTRIAPNREKFEALLDRDVAQAGSQSKTVNTVQAPEKPSLMDEVRKMNSRTETLAQSSPDGIRVQAQELIEHIDDLKSQLRSPNLKLRGSVRNLLRNKLEHIDDNLKIALNKVGIEYSPLSGEAAAPGANPIHRFIGYLTNSQYQLQNLSHVIEQHHLMNKEFTPANMLALQIKIQYVGQQIEFFTASLNKAIESTKTLLNVQV